MCLEELISFLFSCVISHTDALEACLGSFGDYCQAGENRSPDCQTAPAGSDVPLPLQFTVNKVVMHDDPVMLYHTFLMDSATSFHHRG